MRKARDISSCRAQPRSQGLFPEDPGNEVACVTFGTGMSCSSKTTLQPRPLRQDLFFFCVQILFLTSVAYSPVMICVNPGSNLLFHLQKWMIQEVPDLKLNIPIKTFHVALISLSGNRAERKRNIFCHFHN